MSWKHVGCILATKFEYSGDYTSSYIWCAKHREKVVVKHS